MQFGVLGNLRLDEQRAPRRIEPDGEPVGGDVEGVFRQVAGVPVVGGERVPVHDAVEGVELVLHRHPVAVRPDEVAEVRGPGGPHPGEQAGAPAAVVVVGGGHGGGDSTDRGRPSPTGTAACRAGVETRRQRRPHRRGQFRFGGFGHPAQAAEAGQQRLPAARADAGHRIERRTERLGPARPAVEGDGEAVGFVARPLQKLQRRGGPGQPQRFRRAGEEDLLLALRQPGVRQVAEAEVVECGGGGSELAPPPVHQNEVGQFLPLGEHPPVAAEHHFPHGGVVVGLPRHRLDAELPVGRGQRLPALEDDHRGHHLPSAEVRDVERLDAPGLDGQPERLPEGPHPRRRLPARLPEVEIERQPGVPRHQVHHPAAGALRRNMDLHPSAALLPQPVGHQLAPREVERGLDLRWRRPSEFVELLHRRLDQAGVVGRGQFLEREGVPVHHLAAPDEEDLQLGAVALPVEAEDIARPPVGGGPSSAGRSTRRAGAGCPGAAPPPRTAPPPPPPASAG